MMMKFFLLLVAFASVVAQEIDDKYSSENAIITNDITNISVEKDSFEFSLRRNILIKNKKGLKFCRVSLTENEFIEIDDIEAVIKDMSGNVVKELDSDDIEEESISPGYVFYSGNNYKHFELEHFDFPFEIEYSYTISSNSLFFWKGWYPKHSIPTLKSEYNLEVSHHVQFKMQEIGEIPKPNIVVKDKYRNFSWILHDIEAQENEDYIPPENKTQLALKFAALNFEIGDYNGSNASWNEYADWYRNMAADKYSLPPKAKDEIRKIIAGIVDTTEIISALYKHLQDGTRYVAVEPGINGWQPHSAEEVYEHRYGDCKDLSTYMVAMLDVAGIKAYPALARTSSLGKHDSSFVDNVFNHCITVVPLEKDTLWLECTSSYADPESMPYSIEDISVLVIKDDRGEFVTTPQKKSHENYWKSKILGALSINGDLRFIAKLHSGGNQKEYIKTKLTVNSKKENLRYIKSRLGKFSANLKLEDYSIHEEKDGNFSLEFTGYYKKFSKRSGNRIFINLNIYNREEKSDIPEEEIDERVYPIFYHYPYQDIDTVKLRMPKDYVLESKEKNVIFETPFAYYRSSLKCIDNVLLYIREFEIKKNRIGLESYADYKEFITNVSNSDRKKIILKKKI